MEAALYIFRTFTSGFKGKKSEKTFVQRHGSIYPKDRTWLDAYSEANFPLMMSDQAIGKRSFSEQSGRPKDISFHGDVQRRKANTPSRRSSKMRQTCDNKYSLYSQAVIPDRSNHSTKWALSINNFGNGEVYFIWTSLLFRIHMSLTIF